MVFIVVQILHVFMFSTMCCYTCVYNSTSLDTLCTFLYMSRSKNICRPRYRNIYISKYSSMYVAKYIKTISKYIGYQRCQQSSWRPQRPACRRLGGAPPHPFSKELNKCGCFEIGYFNDFRAFQ